ncbi:hypothetical protein L1049_019413 [Liquidambar formosana]|uniref:PsbP C-terminal domain-containing protein n=1 Tax=Liquidambar formosana TaxID=63359 RepID=A0AAP0S5U2_LIQFO
MLTLTNAVMALRICFALSNHETLLPKSMPKAHTNVPRKQKQPQENRNDPRKETPLSSLYMSKRKLNLSIVAVMLYASLPQNTHKAMSEEQQELERYTDSKEGFTLLKPSSWVKVDKAGATVLFEEANVGSNNVGVVVSPVRLTRLGEFGSPQFVADKLIQAEKRKESTKDAEVIGVAERSG